jgi:hypothetical protein
VCLAAIVAFAYLLPVQESSEFSKWIAELRHDDLARRDYAQAVLLKSGEKALPELKKALASKDAEFVVRLRSIIEEIERPGRERLHDGQERKRVLKLCTVDFKDERAPDVLEKLKLLLDTVILGKVDPEARITLSAKDETLRKILDAIEDQAKCTIRNEEGMWRVQATRAPRLPRAYVPGSWLDLTCTPMKVDGKAKGIRIKAAVEGSSHPFIETWEARGKDGTPRPVSRCKSCGPLYAFVETGGEELRLRLTGKLQWNSVYDLPVADPRVAQDFRVALFQIRYEFPKILVTAPEPVEHHRFPSAYLLGRWKEGRRPYSTLRRHGTILTEKKRKPDGWCDCVADELKVDVPTIKPLTARETSDDFGAAAGHFESMKVIFLKPIQEPFDTEVVIPAERTP